MDIRPRPKDPSRQYEHRFHAGNAGDVWKHVVLLALLRRCSPELTYVETHAGAGRYTLGPTGEWREGVGRMLGAPLAQAPEAVRAYAEAVGGGKDHKQGIVYPGSPVLAAGCLAASARLILYELAEAPRQELARCLDARAKVRDGDGVKALAAGFVGEVRGGEESVVVVDPPFHAKTEWNDVPAALVRAAAALPEARFMFWYPIKAHTRPNAMLARLREEGMSGVAAELITAPLAARKNRLAGSGVVVVRPPDGLLPEIGACAAYLGPRLCLHPDAWSLRLTSWGAATEQDVGLSDAS